MKKNGRDVVVKVGGRRIVLRDGTVQKAAVIFSKLTLINVKSIKTYKVFFYILKNK